MSYNGWTNYVTWNVALWVQNDEGLYRLALASPDYPSFRGALREAGVLETPDGVAYNDSGLDLDELASLWRGLSGGVGADA